MLSEQEIELINQLHAASCYMDRAARKYRPYLKNMPSDGNEAFAYARLALQRAFKIIKGEKLE